MIATWATQVGTHVTRSQSRAKPDRAKDNERGRKVLVVRKIQKRENEHEIGWQVKPVIQPLPKLSTAPSRLVTFFFGHVVLGWPLFENSSAFTLPSEGAYHLLAWIDRAGLFGGSNGELVSLQLEEPDLGRAGQNLVPR